MNQIQAANELHSKQTIEALQNALKDMNAKIEEKLDKIGGQYEQRDVKPRKSSLSSNQPIYSNKMFEPNNKMSNPYSNNVKTAKLQTYRSLGHDSQKFTIKTRPAANTVEFTSDQGKRVAKADAASPLLKGNSKLGHHYAAQPFIKRSNNNANIFSQPSRCLINENQNKPSHFNTHRSNVLSNGSKPESSAASGTGSAFSMNFLMQGRPTLGGLMGNNDQAWLSSRKSGLFP